MEYKTCNEKIYNRGCFRPYRCPNKATYGDKCGVHCEEAVAKRKAKSDAKYAAKQKLRLAALIKGANAENELELAKIEITKLKKAIFTTLEQNGHLTDGDNCTLIELKKAINYEQTRI